jgi:flagellar motor switch protein FliN
LKSGERAWTILVRTRCAPPSRRRQPPESRPAKASAAAQLPGWSPRRGRAEPGIELLLDVELEATLRFGCREMPLGEILDLGPGDVVQLDRHVADPVDLIVGDKIVARGEVVLVNGNFGLRVTEVAAPKKAAGEHTMPLLSQERRRGEQAAQAPRARPGGGRRAPPAGAGIEPGMEIGATARPGSLKPAPIPAALGLAASVAQPLGAGL